MSKSEQISRMTDIMARFVGNTGKVLPDDVTAKLQDLHKKETSQLADVIFTTMIENQRLAKELDRPSCQDTGVIQFLVALMEDGQTTQEQPATCICTEKCVTGAVNTACPVCATNMSACM